MKILRIALALPLRKIFDYLPAAATDLSSLQPGMRVLVPFQRRQLVGIFLGVAAESEVDPQKLKSIEAVLDQEPLLSASMLKFCQWAADYYHYALGEVLHTALPVLLRQGKEAKPATIRATKQLRQAALVEAPTLNAKQAEIVQTLKNALQGFSVATLAGVTGSGKTEVYLQVLQAVLAQGKQALVLVPEISLTPQTIARFRERFTVPMVALHSGLNEKARLNAWLEAKSGEAKLIIGTRSAVFTSFADLGLIIVDEEHDPSFKQQDSFRYNARDLAIWRAKETEIPIILGSATPSLETLQRSLEGPYRYFTLPERAGGALMPSFQILDVRRQYLEEGLSAPLLKEIARHLEAGNQALLFLNRRGFAPVLMCHACGWLAECRRCDARLTYHLRPERLHCHHCEAQKPLPKHCENCQAKEIGPLGLGTEKLEVALQKHFPNYPLVRLDRDSTRGKGKMEAMLKGIEEGAYKILLGTQMIAKGHHFPDVTLVGIVDSDYGLFSSDFRASERLGQLILQVAGRAGRAAKPGTVCIQTHHPEHPLIQLLKAGNYPAFAQALLSERRSALLPPFSSLALFHAEAHRSQEVEKFLNQVKALASKLDTSVSIRGPVAALMARRAGRHRMQLLLQAAEKKTLQLFLRKLLRQVDALSTKLRIHWAVDVDPVEMA